LLHALNAGLFFLVLLRWQKGFSVAVAGGLLFAVMAVSSQPVNYLSNRATLFAVCFILLGLLFDWRASESTGSSKVMGVAAALIFFGLGMLSKEIAAAFPALVILEDLFLRKRARIRILVDGIYALGLGFLLWLRWMMFNTLGSNFKPRPYSENLVIQAKAVFFYLKEFLWPIHLSVIPVINPSAGLGDAMVLLALAGLVLISLLAIILWKRAPVFGFAWFWLLAGLAPSSIVPLNVLVSEERLYLPSLGLILGMVSIFSRAREWAKGRAYAYACLALIFLFQLVALEKRIPDWRTESRLWHNEIDNSPTISAGYVMFADALIEDKHYGSALNYFQTALVYDPKNPGAYAGLCNYYLIKHEPEAMVRSAGQYYELALHPMQKAEALSFLAMAQYQMKQREEAEKNARESLSIDPRQSDAMFILAMASKDRGDLAQSEKYARSALEINSQMADADNLLGLVFAESGRTDEAIVHLEKYTEAMPDDATGWFNLGMIYIGKKDFAKAEVDMKKSIALDSKYALPHYGMAVVESARGNDAGALKELGEALELNPDLAQAHNMRAVIDINMLKKGRPASGESKEELLSTIQQEIRWLKSKKIDTTKLEDDLKQSAQ
jgi:tetratricopeptide (TPR) repeat protein